MKQQIVKICKAIEKEYNVRILFCVESGSRAWNLESKDSDYDVRFVFVRPLKDYLQIHLQGEVIKKSFDEEGNPSPEQGCFIDVVGFDIFKYVRMLSSSNPTVIEWLQSYILYYGRKPKAFEDYAENQFNPISLYHHYRSMCKQNYLKYLKSGNVVTYKKYLYALRGLVNAKWVAEHGSLPNIDFQAMLSVLGFDGHEVILSQDVKSKLSEIIEKKQESKEKDIVQNETRIDRYIENFLKEERNDIEKRNTTVTQLNTTLRRIIK